MTALLLTFFMIAVDSLPPLPSPFEVDITKIPRWKPKANNFAAGFLAGNMIIGESGFSWAGKTFMINGQGRYSKDDGYISGKRGQGQFGFGCLHDKVMTKAGVYYLNRESITNYEVGKPELGVALAFANSVLTFDVEYHQGENQDFNFKEGKLSSALYFTGNLFNYKFSVDGMKKLNDRTNYVIGIVLASRSIGRPFNFSFGPTFLFKRDKIFPSFSYKVGQELAIFSGELATGPKFDFFDELLTANMPLVMSPDTLEQRLNFETINNLILTVGRQNLKLGQRYQRWQVRRTIADNWQVDYMPDVTEFGVDLIVENNIEFIKNCLVLKFQAADRTIPFFSKYDVIDTIELSLKKELAIVSSIAFKPSRPGLTGFLKEFFVISSGIHFDFRALTIVMRLENILNERHYMYDDINLLGRRFGAGVRIDL